MSLLIHCLQTNCVLKNCYQVNEIHHSSLLATCPAHSHSCSFSWMHHAPPPAPKPAGCPGETRRALLLCRSCLFHLSACGSLPSNNLSHPLTSCRKPFPGRASGGSDGGGGALKAGCVGFHALRVYGASVGVRRCTRCWGCRDRSRGSPAGGWWSSYLYPLELCCWEVSVAVSQTVVTTESQTTT